MRVLLKKDDKGYQIYDTVSADFRWVSEAELQGVQGVSSEEYCCYNTLEQYVESLIAQQILTQSVPYPLAVFEEQGRLWIGLDANMIEVGDFLDAYTGFVDGVFQIPDYINYLPSYFQVWPARVRVYDSNNALCYLGQAFHASQMLEELYLRKLLRLTDSLLLKQATNLNTVYLHYAEDKWLDLFEIDKEQLVVADNMFMYCSSLCNVDLDDRISVLGEKAFICCDSLKHLKMPKNLSVIGEQCFAKSGLREFTAPSGLREIQARAFYDCRKLETVTLNEGLETIYTDAFGECNRLMYLRVPGSVTHMPMSFASHNIIIATPEGSAAWKAVSDWNKKYTNMQYRLIKG